MIVIDASATIDLILNRRRGQRVVEAFLEGEIINAPFLLDVEVLHSLRRMVSLRRVTEERARAAIRVYGEIIIRRHPHRDLMPKVWSLRHNITAYDAMYVALAQQLGATLLTADSKLATAAETHVTVDVLPIK